MITIFQASSFYQEGVTVEPISQAHLNVLIYKELMGILGNKKKAKMIEALNRKGEKGQLEPLERRIWTAFTLHPSNNKRDADLRREFLKSELNIWEKRTQI